ncbi:hypothetical protein KW797_00440 [Candidatus Parcubacteria bacterium]|nr:hypothetical protein [Candidatus Parcubacteria bacterium]
MTTVMLGNGGPDFDYVFLSGQMAPGHQAFEELSRKYSQTPQGQRLIRFHQQNAQFKDELPARNMAQLDSIIRNEGVIYNGERDDRIGKIIIIRAHRVEAEKEKLSAMTPEERVAYLAEKTEQEKDFLSEQQRQELQEQKAAAERLIERKKKVSDFEKKRLEALEKRDQQRKANQEFLDAEQAKRSNAINPVAARKLAEEKRRKEEEEATATIVHSDADHVAGLGDSQMAPGDSIDSHMGGSNQGSVDGAPGANLESALTREDRADELTAMQPSQLDEILVSYGLIPGSEMTTGQRIVSIIEHEFQD